MKQTLILKTFILAMILLAVVGCSKDKVTSPDKDDKTDPEIKPQASLVGSWKLTSYTENGETFSADADVQIRFRPDGSGTVSVNGESVQMTWSDNGSSIALKGSFGEGSLPYTLSGNRLSLTMSEDGYTWVEHYTRQ